MHKLKMLDYFEIITPNCELCSVHTQHIAENAFSPNVVRKATVFITSQV